MKLDQDTKLSNGSTLGEVFKSVRADLAAARALRERGEKNGPGRGMTLRVLRENEARALGKLQGYANLLTLLGVDYEALDKPQGKPQAVVTVSHNGRKATVYIQREHEGWYWATTTEQNADQGYTLKANGEAFKETYRDGEKLGSVKVGTWALA